MKNRKTWKLIGKILFYILFTVVLLLVVGMLISKITNRVFFVGKSATIWVMTDSMEDEIPANSYIRIKKIAPSEIKIGDVITYYSDDPILRGNLNTHRVVEILDGGESFVTKGDNNLGNDIYPARAEAVIGVYEKNCPILTAAGRVFRSRIGLIGLILVMALITILSFAWDPIKKQLEKRKKNSQPEEK